MCFSFCIFNESVEIRIWYDYDGRAGEEQLATVALPNRKQEPYRYTDLESLYRTDFLAAPAQGAGSTTGAAQLDNYLMETTKGQQMVFVNGVFSPTLSDVSGLGGLEGVVAGNLGGLEGEQLAQVCVRVCVCWNDIIRNGCRSYFVIKFENGFGVGHHMLFHTSIVVSLSHVLVLFWRPLLVVGARLSGRRQWVEVLMPQALARSGFATVCMKLSVLINTSAGYCTIPSKPWNGFWSML